MLDGSMIQFVYGMTLAELIGAAPQAKPMYEAVVNALNAECKITNNSYLSHFSFRYSPGVTW